MSDSEKTDNQDVNEVATGEVTADTPVEADAAVEEHHHDHDHDHHDHHGHHHHEEEKPFAFEQDPVYDVEYKGDCAYEVKVTVPAANLRKQSGEMLKQLQEEAMIPGFRKGKAPIKLVQNKFNKAVRTDAIDKLVDESFHKLVKDKDLKPIGAPKADGLEDKAALKEDEDLDFTLSFEVSPRCELGPYRGIEVERPVVHINEKDIDEVLERMRERLAMYETAEEAAQDGDQVLIDFEGRIDGEAFQGNSAENYPYIMGSARFLSEFEAALTGKKAGDTAAADVTFPADWRNADLAGKTAKFEIKINEVKRRALPEINDDFAKQAGQESLEAWRKSVEEQLRADTAEQSDSYARNSAMEKIIAGTNFEVPKTLLDSMAHSAYEAALERLRRQRQSVESEEQGQALLASTREDALREIKEFVILREIAEAEGIEVVDQDFEDHAASLATSAGVDKEIALGYLLGDEQRGRTETNILHKKVFDVILEHATIVEKELKDEDPSGADAESAKDAQ